MRNQFYILSAIILLLFLVKGQDMKDKRFLLLGMDGLDYQYMQELIAEGKLPNLQRLMLQKGYTGGVTDTPTESRPLSAPSWRTVFTGVYQNKHTNFLNYLSEPNEEYPTVYKYLRSQSDKLQILTYFGWTAFQTQILADSLQFMDDFERFAKDTDMVQKVLEVLSVENKFEESEGVFITAIWNDIDALAHLVGFSPQQAAIIEQTDFQLGLMLDLIALRQQQYKNEDWQIILVSDHGRDSMGLHHGLTSKAPFSEKLIVLGSNNKLNFEYHYPLTAPNEGLQGLYSYPSQASITPTILKFFDFDFSEFGNNHFDDIPWIGPLGVRKLMIHENKFQWSFTGDGEDSIQQDGEDDGELDLVDIFVDGEYIESVEIQDRMWPGDDLDSKEAFINGLVFEFYRNDVKVLYLKKNFSIFEQSGSVLRLSLFLLALSIVLLF